MRGNIGIEIDAVYDVVKPDFMMIARAIRKIIVRFGRAFITWAVYRSQKRKLPLIPKHP